MGRTKIFVSSTVYNLMGNQEPVKIENIATIQGALAGVSIGKHIVTNVLRGNGVKFKSFIRWAYKFGYTDYIGAVVSSIRTPIKFSKQDLEKYAKKLIPDFIPKPSAPPDGSSILDYDEIEINIGHIGELDPYIYTSLYIAEHHPDKIHPNLGLDQENDVFEIDIVVDEPSGNEFNQDLPMKVTYKFLDGSIENSFIIPQNLVNADEVIMLMFTLHRFRNGVETTKAITIAKPFPTGDPGLDSIIPKPKKYKGTFAPYIPVRWWKHSCNPKDDKDTWKWCGKACKKAFGKRKQYQILVDQVNDNKSIGDIDFCYIVFGIPINVKANYVQQYFYKFFYNIFQSTEPYIPPNSVPQNKRRGGGSLLMRSHEGFNFHVSIHWGGMLFSDTPYIGKPKGVKGNYWTTFENNYMTFNEKKGNRLHKLYVSNLVYKNKVYKHSAVEYKAKDEYWLPEEDAKYSGFIVPLELNAMKACSLVKLTNTTQYSGNLVFNSYKEVKKKWYQTGIFKVIVIIIAVVITVVSIAYGQPQGTTIGSALVAGLGVGGVAAAILSFAINAVVAAVLSAIIRAIAVALFPNLFGELLGAIIGSLVSYYAVTGLGFSAETGFSFNTSVIYNDLLSVDNILSFTGSILKDMSKTINKYYQNKSIALGKEMKAFSEKANKEMEKINKLMKDLQGKDLSYMLGALMDTRTPEQFFTTTLAYGSDIAKASIEGISQMPVQTLTLQ